MTAKEATLKSDKLSEYVRIVEDWKKHYMVGDDGVYRGHADFNWIVIAKLFRDPDAKPENREG